MYKQEKKEDIRWRVPTYELDSTLQIINVQNGISSLFEGLAVYVASFIKSKYRQQQLKF